MVEGGSRRPPLRELRPRQVRDHLGKTYAAFRADDLLDLADGYYVVERL